MQLQPNKALVRAQTSFASFVPHSLVAGGLAVEMTNHQEDNPKHTRI